MEVTHGRNGALDNYPGTVAFMELKKRATLAPECFSEQARLSDQDTSIAYGNLCFGFGFGACAYGNVRIACFFFEKMSPAVPLLSLMILAIGCDTGGSEIDSLDVLGATPSPDFQQDGTVEL